MQTGACLDVVVNNQIIWVFAYTPVIMEVNTYMEVTL